MNLVEIMGNVGNDPEERVTPSGTKITSFRIADNVRRGENEETIWWRVTVWGNQFDRMMPYIKKGSSLIVHGEIRKKPDIYQDRNGNSQVSLEITATQLRFSPFGRGNNSQESASPQASVNPTSQDYPSSNPPSSAPGGFRPAVGVSNDFSEDNLPF